MHTLIGTGNFGKQAEASAARITRRFALDPSWTDVRLGCRLIMDDVGYNMVGIVTLGFGFCSSSGNPYDDTESTGHFVGVRTTQSTATLTRTAGDFYSMGNFQLIKRVGTTDTLASSIGIMGMSINPDRRVGLFFTIRKGTPYSVEAYMHDNSSVTADLDDSTFATAMNTTGTPSITGYTNYASTIAVDEGTDGTLDCLNFFWKVNWPHMNVQDIRVASVAIP